MGFSSLDDMISEISSGKYQHTRFQKVSSNGATSAAGRWHEWFTATGIPAAGSFTGTAGVATQMTRTTTGAMDVNADVSTDTRHLLSGSMWTASSVITPATAILVDMLLYYPACVVTGTPTTLDNTATLPRYTNGKGVMCIIAVQTALGAASPALTLTYTDDSSNTGNASSAMTSPANSAPISTMFAAGTGAPFLPLLAGDVGIKKIESYTLASGTTGTAAFILVKPLAEFPIVAQYVPGEREFVTQLPALPQIVDGACLGWLTLLGGAMTTSQAISGHINFAWG